MSNTVRVIIAIAAIAAASASPVSAQVQQGALPAFTVPIPLRIPDRVLTGADTAVTAPAVLAPPVTPWFYRLPADFNGSLTTMGELYAHRGTVDARRPAGIWRVSMNPSLTLFKEVTMATDIQLSSEGSQVRQSVNHLGFKPKWKFVAVNAGDFTRDYSPYTMSGTRIRGGGVDLTPGNWLASFQGGRAQRTVAAGSDGAAYRRDLVAASFGYGRDGGNRISITALKAKDDPNSLEQQLIVVDTTVSDTAIVPDLLRFATTPQENLVVALASELEFFGMLQVRGEVGASLFSRDIRSAPVGEADVGLLKAIDALQPIRLSTSGDAAFLGDIALRRPTWGINGGYERVGPGYTSLGLPNLINDQTGFHVGGNTTLLRNRLMLSGETRQQANNLVDQRSAATRRGNSMGSAVVVFSPTLTTSLTVVTSNAATDSSAVAPGIDMRTLAVTTSVNARVALRKKMTSLSLGYSRQTAMDALPESAIPNTVGHNVTLAATTAFTPRLSFGPSVSTVSSQTGTAATQTNVLLGFNLKSRWLEKDRLSLNANVSNTSSSGRQIRAMRAEAGYSIFWDSKLSVQARHTNYSAFANRPGFSETFLTTTVTRNLLPARKR